MKKVERQCWSRASADLAKVDPIRLDPGRPERAIRERLGWDGTLLTFDFEALDALLRDDGRATCGSYAMFSRATVVCENGIIHIDDLSLRSRLNSPSLSWSSNERSEHRSYA